MPLTRLGAERLVCDPCMWRVCRQDRDQKIVVGVITSHVDDFLLASTKMMKHGCPLLRRSKPHTSGLPARLRTLVIAGYAWPSMRTVASALTIAETSSRTSRGTPHDGCRGLSSTSSARVDSIERLPNGPSTLNEAWTSTKLVCHSRAVCDSSCQQTCEGGSRKQRHQCQYSAAWTL